MGDCKLAGNLKTPIATNPGARRVEAHGGITQQRCDNFTVERPVGRQQFRSFTAGDDGQIQARGGRVVTHESYPARSLGDADIYNASHSLRFAANPKCGVGMTGVNL
ncbi:MAG TPA: hypothetical protein VEG63_01320 [Candidatus Acidoferrales bacterium]|nr:hypothetical protein [Candidatus Acidoferrales bacterium]